MREIVGILLLALAIAVAPGCPPDQDLHQDRRPDDDDTGDDDTQGDDDTDDDDTGDDDTGDDDTHGDDDTGDDDTHGDDDTGDDDTHGDDDTGPYCYTEEVDPSASLADLEAAFYGLNWKDTIFEVTYRRYPSGHELLQEMQNDPQMGNFVQTQSFALLVESLMTVVHEETHGYDYEYAQWGSSFAYFVNGDWQPQVPYHEGFPRGEIYGMLDDSSCDMYADTYLVGYQGTFDFMELLDELNCYINGLAAIALVGEYEPWGISARDGALALMYFLELYLEKARYEYPTVYGAASADAHMVDLVLIQWLRLHFFLDISYAFPNLGVGDHAIEDHMHDPEHQGEIELFVGRDLQASNCLLPGDPYQPPF